MRVAGGASWPAAIGTTTVTYPLAILLADADGVSVDIRFTFMKRALSRLVRRSPTSVAFGDAWWGASWPDLSPARRSKRAVVLTSNDGSRCRFVAPRRAKIDAIAIEFDRHKVPIEPVRSTLSYYWTWK